MMSAKRGWRLGMLGALFLFGAGLQAVAAEDLVQLPDDIASYKGDPARGPEPEAKYQKPGKWTPTLREVVLAAGNPLFDYGHFRMKIDTVDSRRSPLVYTPSDEELKKAHARFEDVAWKDGKELHYSILKPEESIKAPKNGFPLVISFPGIGGIGKESLTLSKKKSSQPLLWGTDAFRKAFPAYVVHMHPKSKTHEYREEGGADATPMVDHYLDLIDFLVETYDVDKKRIYVYGFSMGGTSCWQVMLKRPTFFAAAVPCAGVPLVDPEEAKQVKDMPIWMFCGNQDPWSGSIMYIKTFQNLEDAGAKTVRFWEIQDLAHSAPQLYMPLIADWLFKQVRD